ncbi:MAG: DNA polymerase I [Oscillospiraceae bacterium]|jgi:DNA polymerase-1|nr:DNA polymerase I [Oscillospiraceae bacterium]
MKLMVLDGNSVVNRAYYGVRQLTTRDGQPTNGVFGFLQILHKLLTDDAPDALCVTFDLRAPTFRHELYEGYKASRTGMPDDLAAQMPVLREVLDALNIPRFELAGWEADDLIGAIAARCEAAGWDCVIVTGDKDSFQLVTDHVRVRHVKSRMGQTETRDYTPATFFDEYGFTPEKIVDLKALMGDSSDEIPGVKGIGEKTAMDLVQRYGTIDAIFADVPALDIKDGVRKKLLEGEESARMSYTLATIRRDAPFDFTPEACARRAPDNDKLYGLFRRLEFNKFIERYNLHEPQAEREEHALPETVTVMVAADASAFRAAIQATELYPIAVRADATLDKIAVAVGGTAYVLSRDTTANYDALLCELFAAPVLKAGHDVKDVLRGLGELGVESGGWVQDTALAAYLLSPTDKTYDLATLARVYLNITLAAAPDAQLSLFDETDDTATITAEVAAIAALNPLLSQKLGDANLAELLTDMELPLCATLADMERAGVLVDRAALTTFGNMLSLRITELEEAVTASAGRPFKINSPKQLGEVLFDELHLPAPKRTKTGYSTNIDVLDRLEGYHPIIGQIKEYRELTKLKSTYADGLLKVIAPDGRIHTSFQMTVTATGRLSSTEPNLQNIPVRRELGAELRRMFIAAPGNTLVDADYSQIELRLLAHIADDEIMRRAFIDGEDIHAVTASQVFGVPLELVTPLMRSRAKAVNFGIVYGISAFSLSNDIGVTVAEAKQYMENYLEKYSGVRAYMSDIVERAKRDGYVATLFGRRRSLPELRSSDHNVRSFGERVALNMPVQGTAADIMKIAMNGVHARIARENLSARLLLQVHDELIVECPDEETDAVSRLLQEEMENAAHLSVPLTAETHAGRSWADAK